MHHLPSREERCTTCGDDEGLTGGVDVGLRPWQHPDAGQLKERTYTSKWSVDSTQLHAGVREVDELTVGNRRRDGRYGCCLSPSEGRLCMMKACTQESVDK